MVIDLASMADPIHPDDLSSYFRQLQIQVTGFGSWRRNENRRISNFIVSEYELSYLQKGRLRIDVGNQQFVCGDGTIFLFEPFVPYSVEKLYDDNMDLYNVFFDFSAGYLPENFLARILLPGQPLWHKKDLPDLDSLFSDVFSLCQENSQGKQVMVSSLLNLCLMYMARARLRYGPANIPDSPGTDYAHKNLVVKEAVAYIQQNIHEPIKLYHLCRRIGVGESYLYKCFTDVLHSSPKQYIIQYRIKQAVQLLRYGGCSINETAARLGFSSGYHLSNSFKKVLGVSPSQYLSDSDITPL